MTFDLDVAVVGAGIAGLAAAERLRSWGRQVQVFEASDHLGGRMHTVRRRGYVVDTGAEMLAGPAGYPATWRLAAHLGLTEDEMPHLTGGLAVWREGRAHPGVGDPRAVRGGAGLSLAARFALGALLTQTKLRSRRFDTDRPEATPLGAQTLAELLTGKPADLHDYLFAPLAAGFYGWDTALACAGPFLAHMAAVGAPSTYRTYRDGMDTAARMLAARVPVALRTPVHWVEPFGPGVRLGVAGTPVTARQAVLAVPAPVAAALCPTAPAYVRAVRFQPMVKVSYLLDRAMAPLEPGSFAVMVPPVENPVLVGVVQDELRNPGRVPPGRGLVGLVAGPGAVSELVDAPPDRVAEAMLVEGERYLPGLRSQVRDVVVVAFRHGLPMPTAESLALREDFVHRPPSAIEFAGDWYSLRPSSEAAVRSAELVSDRVLARLPTLAVPRG